MLGDFGGNGFARKMMLFDSSRQVPANHIEIRVV